ncbi:het domain protein [Colletotrichum sojae]|uniref:Het domain protein n=1 Tax=Colletotrichum sojae TaxID=2175907 RepID=A0A8H6IMA8_9PEZI|nr:het domain protein [Colletotrichum sojae]
MRLINTESLKLKEFADDNLPPYSILSHLWGDERGRQIKPGNAKIVNFCRVSRENGFYWAWADTVCIDKSDYDEHNTAINSMFAWHEQSEVCLFVLYCLPLGKVIFSSLDSAHDGKKVAVRPVAFR